MLNLYTLDQMVRAVVPLLTNRKLRRQYQPKAIQRLIDNFLSGKRVGRIRIGCGGGKTYIFILALCWLYANGHITKSVIVAPTIALTRQLENEFCTILERMIKIMHVKFGMRLESKFTVVNVSSDIPESDETEEYEDDTEYEGIERVAYIDRVDERKVDALNELLKTRKYAAYFVCLKSYKEKFAKCLDRTKAKIGVTVFDEFHNLISDEKFSTNESIKAIKITKAQSQSTWFFSASAKFGAVMRTDDVSIFGEELVKVYSSELVRWGYLVKNINIDLVTTGALRGLTPALNNYFDAKSVVAGKLYSEWAFIEHCISVLLKRGETPRVIMFGAHVPTMAELIKTPRFLERIQQLCPGIKVFGIFGGEVIGCPQELRNKSAKEQRGGVFKEIKTTKSPFILLNHSVLKEGIDVTRFNGLFITRNMNEIGVQQSFGRVQRLDADSGKTTAHIFIQIADEADERISGKTAELIHSIQYALGDTSVTISGLSQDKTGVAVDDDNRQFVNVGSISIPHLVVKTAGKKFQPGKKIPAGWL